MSRWVDHVLGIKVKGVRVVPLTLKILTLFSIFLLLSNFVTNYINLMLNRGELMRLMNELLVKDLKDNYIFATNQYDIYFFNEDLEGAIAAMEQNAEKELKGQKSLYLGVKPDGKIAVMASKQPRWEEFPDPATLQKLNRNRENQVSEGTISFRYGGEEYFGVYKYNPKWGFYLIRAEEMKEFSAESRRIFWNIAGLIVAITLVCVVVGIFLLRFILRFVGHFTREIMAMQQEQKISLLNLEGAPNDDVSFLGVAFNSLSNTIDNLLTIFKKFVARDTAQRAYREREIRLEGSKKDLAILFTDIKGFTFMTETLGTDIIKLLNLHYDRAIRYIHQLNGDIGSIIGDALLAVFGLLEQERKSLQAIQAAYRIQEVAASLRQEMTKRKEEIVKRRGALTEAEERVYRAVLLEVGVGIDGGEVFYGTIGSYERMVNTVIGDNVNSASRLEGLTRIYKVPVIVSDYIREEVESATNQYVFVELDQVQVKGKTEGKRIYWPIEWGLVDEDLQKELDTFKTGLEAYYQGDWTEANRYFSRCDLPLAEVFRDRTGSYPCPKDWNGIWAMKEK
ncbi:MAG: hypothetical protein Kow009_08460 [Spirochaetales bacterium]